MAQSDIFGRLLDFLSIPRFLGRLSKIRFWTVAVSGLSMAPAYREGDWLFVRWFHMGNPAAQRIGTKWIDRKWIGKVVVIERESQPGVFLIKRLIRLEGDRFWVEGDGAGSTDSRHWGALTQAEIVGLVLFRFKRARSSR